MAHELTQRKNGFIEFAATGSRQQVWHGLGQYLEDGASIDTWKEQSGLDWTIDRSAVQFVVPNVGTVTEENRHVLYRQDNNNVLGIVSKDYKIVQPGEVLEFFRDLTELNGMKLSAAGSLMGGKKYWATAELGKSAEIVSGDAINGFLLLVSSADGSTSTIATLTSTRVVCANTLRIAMNGAKNAVKVSHASEFDAKQVKVDMGLIDSSWDSFITNLRRMASVKVTDDKAQEFFAKLVTPKDSVVDMELLKTQRHVDAMMHFYKRGAGNAEYAPGTMYSILNGVTECLTFGTGKRNNSAQFERSELGVDSKMKLDAYNQLVAMM